MKLLALLGLVALMATFGILASRAFMSGDMGRAWLASAVVLAGGAVLGVVMRRV